MKFPEIYRRVTHLFGENKYVSKRFVYALAWGDNALGSFETIIGHKLSYLLPKIFKLLPKFSKMG